MKKSKMMLGSAIMLAVLLVVGGTMAWFTAQAEEVVNEFEAGTVKIKIHEIFDEDAAKNVNPGDCYEKVIYVENTGTKRAYIRIKADAVFTAADGVTLLDGANILGYGVNAPRKDWTWPWGYKLVPGWTHKVINGEGYFYYDTVVQPGGFTKPLLECNRVCFNGEAMGNEYQGSTLDIIINADAIQATHSAAQSEWGVTYPIIKSEGSRNALSVEDKEENLTEADVQVIVAEQEAAFEALNIE